MFVGRGSEIDALESTLEAAIAGRGALRVLCGEPGIGKTRLADELSTRAISKGMRTCWGRAWETGGAPAYWPWIELLGPLADAADLPARVRELLDSSAGSAVGEETRADPARERFELFESVSAFVRASARQQPLLIVLDDLHAADLPSLELLAFVARGLRTSRLVALCTVRDTEARLAPGADLIARISREGETLLLRRLSSDDVAALVRHELGSADARLATAVAELTEGNPLFLRETIHAVNTHGIVASPDALREVAALGGVLALVRGRLAGAPGGTRTVLEAASALGREFDAPLLAETAKQELEATRAALDDATARGLLVRRSEDRWAFSHLLVREAFYRELSAADRRAHHHAVATALAERLEAPAPSGVATGTSSEMSLATLAHHRMLALPLSDPVTAARTACRAAAQARSHLAYEEAIALLEKAHSTCKEYDVEDRERAEVLLALGWAVTEAGKLIRGREIFREALSIARRLGDAALVARAALGQGGEYVLGEIRPELVEALREALGALEGSDGDEARRLRARVLARLAAALTPSKTADEPLGLARQALAMTEGETDGRTRIDVDTGVGAAFADFAPPAERVVVNERLYREARRISDRILELRALTRLGCDHLELGDVARSDAVIAERATLAESIGHPRYRWQTPLLRSMQAMPRGHFDDCEAHILEARRLAAEASDPNAERCIEFHRFSMLLLAGRYDGLRQQQANAQRTLLRLVGNENLDAWLTVVAAVRLGDIERAVKVLREIVPSLNSARLVRVTMLEAAVTAGVREYYEEVYGLIDGSENANVGWGPFAFSCLPPIAHSLSIAAFALGRTNDALAHAERALELVNHTDADAHRAWVHLALAEGTGSREHGERAAGLAEGLGMPDVAVRARAVVERARESTLRGGAREPGVLEATSPKSSLETATFSLRYDRKRQHWTIEHAGRSFQLKDVRGLGMLAQLVEQPGREIHALDLASEPRSETDRAGAIDLGDAGEVIDLKARSAYKQRIESLREELAEAESWQDRARAERLRAELEALTEQIAAATGLGGRERRSGSAAERARTVVQRRIREAIKKIADEDPDLGRHLGWAVRTGTFCAYEPAGKKSAH